MESAKRPMLAGTLAKVAGVSTDTLRHYERVGLIPKAPRRPNGYRVYPPETLDRVRVVRKALAMGFTIRELADILRARERGGAPCARVRALAAAKLQELEERLREMARLRESLARTIRDWDGRLAATPDGHRAGLLDSLIEEAPAARARRIDEGGNREDSNADRDPRGRARRIRGGANAARTGHGPSRPPGHGLGSVQGEAHLRHGRQRRQHRGEGE